PPPPPGTCTSPFFGPKKYARTCGQKTTYVTTVTVPASVRPPFVLKVQNGESDGRHRVSSAWIYVNDVQVAEPADFSQQVSGFERPVTLTPTTTLKVVLASAPGSYLRISLCGGKGDATPPDLVWMEPPPGTATNDATPRLLVRYQDPPGPGDTAGSGIDVQTLKVLLDDVDRTALFTRRSDEASAVLPPELALAEGLHRLRASIKDVAGNVGEETAEFTLDLTPPVVTVVEPAGGSYLGTSTPPVRIQYQDNLALDFASLRVRVNGEDRTSACQAGPVEAVCTIAALPEGSNAVQAEVRDLAGNLGMASSTFNVDTVPPALTIGQPVEGSRHGSPQVEVIVQYADTQGLDLASFQAAVDGSPASLSQGPEGAIGTIGPLADGAHVFSVTIRDRAGNPRTAQVGFTVDATAPRIRVVQPPPGFILATRQPFILVEYEDAQGLDLPSFRLRVDGQDRTSVCQVDPDAARCTLPAESALADGPHTVLGEIQDATGNPGSATSDFTVDTAPPQ
ncbi:MAG: hypothetical protein ACRDKW_02350, partial [Actinomycetota bacterium]